MSETDWVDVDTANSDWVDVAPKKTSFMQEAFVKPAKSFYGGTLQAAGETARVADLWADKIAKTLGMPETKDSVFEYLSNNWSTVGRRLQKEGLSLGLAKEIYSGAGRAGWDIPKIMSFGRFGMPITGALEEGAEGGVGGMVSGGARGALMQGTIRGLSRTPAPIKYPSAFGVGYATGGETPEERIGSGLTFAGLLAGRSPSMRQFTETQREFNPLAYKFVKDIRETSSRIGRGVERVGAAVSGVEPDVLAEIRQRGFRTVLQKKYYDKKLPEQIVENIDESVEGLRKVAGDKYDEVTTSVQKERFDYNRILRDVNKLSLSLEKNPFKGPSKDLNYTILDGLRDPSLEVKTIGDVLRLRRNLDEVLYTAKGQQIKSEFGKDVRDIFNKYLHKNEVLAKADSEWYTLQNILRENQKVMGETGENYLKRWEKLTTKQKENLALLERELLAKNPNAQPFIENLTNYSLAQELRTPTLSSIYPFSVLHTLTRPLYRGYLRKFGTFPNPNMPTKGGGKPFKSLGAGGFGKFAGKETKTLNMPIGQSLSLRNLQGKKMSFTRKPNENILIEPIAKEGKIKYFQVHDGDVIDVNKGVAQDLMNRFGVKEVKGKFAPELSQVEEVVKGVTKQEKYNFKEQPDGSFIESKSKWRIEFDDNINQWKVFDSGGNEFNSYSSIGEAKQDALNNLSGKVLDKTKFSQYQLPGGENYREVLIKAPSEKETLVPVRAFASKKGGVEVELSNGKTIRFPRLETEVEGMEAAQEQINAGLQGKTQGFKSSHWDEPNVLAHIRLNDRTTPDGKKVLFIEEIQSDWAREAKKAGYRDVPTAIPFEDAPSGVSFKSHPLLKNWQELALKNAIKKAVDGGYDYISWATGEQQAERYDLSKQVKSIKWQPFNDGKAIEIKPTNGSQIAVYTDKDGIIRKDMGGGGVRTEWQGKKLEDVIGKDHAKKVMESKSGDLSGEGLKIGAEWAKNLYDKQIPNILKDLTKGSVENIDTHAITGKGKTSKFGYNEQGELVPQGEGQSYEGTWLYDQPALKITPEIKAVISGKPTPTGGGKTLKFGKFKGGK